MRIISGWARGRKLHTPGVREKEIRPTSDRAREALFNIIADRLPGSRVLDLFAGTGAFGLEAASRGATLVVFVDLHRRPLELIRQNLTLLDPASHGCQTTVLRHDLRRGLPPALLPEGGGQPFDIIFLDPPYSQGVSVTTLEWLGKGSLLQEDSLVVVEERATETLPATCGRLSLTDNRRYGEAGFWFYAPGQQSSPAQEV